MKSFMYLVELILVGLLLISYLYYVKAPRALEEMLYLFEKKYLYDTLSLSTLNLKVLNFEELFKINYLIYSEKIKAFSQKLEKLDLINIKLNNKTDCVMFFYPFPELDLESYYSKNYSNFVIYDIDGNSCKNFTVSNDWKLIEIYNFQGGNISLYLKNYFNLLNLDPYSIFVFDNLGNEIFIEGIAFDSFYLNLTGIKFNETIHKLPINILIRIKESPTIENLLYIAGRYKIYNSIRANETMFSIKESNWLTIYINDTCILKETLVLRYTLSPSLKYQTFLSKEINKEKCRGDYNVSYFIINFLEKYNNSVLTKLNAAGEIIRSDYENTIYIINGQNLALLKIYGS